MNRNGNEPKRGFWASIAALMGREACPGSMEYDPQIKKFVCNACPRVHWVNSPMHMRNIRDAR